MVGGASVLLAGGRGERVGGDKAGLIVGGRPLIDRMATILERVGLPVIVALRADQAVPRAFDGGTARVVRDVEGVEGPLAGILAALEHAHEAGIGWVFLVAVDMPLLAPELPAALLRRRAGPDAGGANLRVPRVDGRDHVLASIVDVAVTAPLRSLVEGGERGVSRAFTRLGARYVTASELLEDDALRVADPELRSFTNVNTPDDVSRVESFFALAKA